MERKNINIRELELNTGQIEGLPKNPRFIRDDRFAKLVKSIEDAPELLEYRTLLVMPHNGKYVTVCGNMRLRACRKIGYSIMPCVVLDEGTSAEKLREYAIKDNIGYGSDDWDAIANEWDTQELEDWGVELPTQWDTDDRSEFEKQQELMRERLASGEIREEDEEYQEFLKKFELAKTTDDCFTPPVIYEAVADFVAEEYKLDKNTFTRPFYPGGDYTKEDYSGKVVVDNPPFSILAEILKFYKKNDVMFFLFAPHITLFSSSSSYSSALCIGVPITYENNANVSTSFLTNLEDKSVRLKSLPRLYDKVKEANDNNLKELRKQLPKYSYDHHIITSTFVSSLSRLGIEFSVPVAESEPISQLESQKDSGKTIFGKGYIVSDRVFVEREKVEREKAEREKAEREKAEREKAEREKAEMWELRDKELAIIRRLNIANSEK